MTAGGGPDEVAGAAGADDGQEDAGLEEWARAWVETFPAWSDERWARAALGYRLVEPDDEAE